MGVTDLMNLSKEELAKHAQEGWDLANRRTIELERCKAALEHVVKAERVVEHGTFSVAGCPFCDVVKMAHESAK